MISSHPPSLYFFFGRSIQLAALCRQRLNFEGLVKNYNLEVFKLFSLLKTSGSYPNYVAFQLFQHLVAKHALRCTC